jgi:flagellin-like protein
MKVFMRQKGISPILAAVFLVAIAVTMLPIFSGWYTTLIGTSTDTVGNRTEETVRCNAASLTIEDVFLDFSNNKARINIRNSGFNTEKIVSAVVFATNGSLAGNLTEYPTNLTKGNFKSLTFNIAEILTVCGNFSHAIVSSRCDTVKYEGIPKNC